MRDTTVYSLLDISSERLQFKRFMVETIQWTDDGVVMIDQTRLPREQVFVTCKTYEEVAEAIRSMIIRGAPAIGVAAAMGVAIGALRSSDVHGEMDKSARRWRGLGRLR
jgi:methylthioribose-1-phosphate isomerase